MNEGSSILFLFGILGLIALIIKILRPGKGKSGEIKVSKRLMRLNPKIYRVINDVLITNQGRSSQIDHIIISFYGIFVIETKNYKGWIFGHESADEWTQVIYHNKYKLRNPIQQNWGHIRTLKAVLSEFPSIPYFPIIVFAGTAKLKNIQSTVPVMTLSRLKRYILQNSTTAVLSIEEVEQIYQQIILLKRTDKVSRKSHIRKAKTNQRRGLKSLTCPRCGGKLILKDGKYGQFYGCSHYPDCDYTKNFT